MAGDGRSLPREVLDDGRGGRSPGERWSAMPPRRRRAISAATAAILGCTAASVGVRQGQDWLAERRLQDQVRLRGEFEIQAWSSPLAGDRVHFYADLHNAGSRTIRVTAIEITQPRLRIRNRGAPRRPIPAGETLRVPLSVVLDCTDRRPARPAEPMRGAVGASAANGRVRSVPSSFDRGALITDVADTLCRVRPNLRGAELSGPIW